MGDLRPHRNTYSRTYMPKRNSPMADYQLFVISRHQKQPTHEEDIASLTVHDTVVAAFKVGTAGNRGKHASTSLAHVGEGGGVGVAGAKHTARTSYQQRGVKKSMSGKRTCRGLVPGIATSSTVHCMQADSRDRSVDCAHRWGSSANDR